MKDEKALQRIAEGTDGKARKHLLNLSNREEKNREQ